MSDEALPHDDVGTGPVLVLIHAGVADRTMWAEHLQPLAGAGMRVIAVDLPGFGECPVDPIEDAPWKNVIATMDALGVGHATLVGNSYGGAVAQRVAVLAPERLESLVLVSSPASGIEPSAELKAAWQAEEAALADGDIEGAVAAVVDAWTLPDAPSELRERIATMQRRAFELGEQVAAEAPDPLERGLEPLARVDAPALILVGEHDKRDFHLAAAALAEALPPARPITIPGAGHLAPMERPDAFRERLLSFVQ